MSGKLDYFVFSDLSGVKIDDIKGFCVRCWVLGMGGWGWGAAGWGM